MADEYLKSLDPWRKLLPLHFSTWPEQPGDTRSDSHAWTSHPIYDLLTLVAGVEPASPGFATVKIEPHLGNLESLNASYPHPQGEIRISYHTTPAHPDPQVKGGVTFHAESRCRVRFSGKFVFDGRSWELRPGKNKIDVPMR